MCNTYVDKILLLYDNIPRDCVERNMKILDSNPNLNIFKGFFSLGKLEPYKNLGRQKKIYIKRRINRYKIFVKKSRFYL